MNQESRRTRVAAYGLVTTDDKILLCRISSELPRWEGQWTLPGGGLEFGESPENAMIREVREETGLMVSALSIEAINSIHDSTSMPEFHGIRVIYRTRILGGELVSEVKGTTDMACWFTKEEVRNEALVDIAQLGVKLVFEPGPES